MKNRFGEPIIRFRFSHLLLVVVWVAIVSSLYESPCLSAGAGSLMIVGYLHSLSLGRTSPLAAFAFVISTAVIGIGAGLPYLIGELQGKAFVQNISDEDMNQFFVATPCYGMVVAAIVAVIAAIENRDVWFNHL